MGWRVSFAVIMRFLEWLKRRHYEREARRRVARAFGDPEILRGTSLGPRHAARWVLLDHEVEDGRVVRAWFGILRHPRPYAFSGQSHKVIEYYRYDIDARRIERVEGRNVTRERGRDAD